MSNEDDILDFLEHWGVLGMKWGVRKERYSRRNRAKNNEAKAKKFQAQIDELKRTGKGPSWKKYELADKRDLQKAKAKAKRDGKMTPMQKKMLIGAAVTAGLVGTYALYRLADHGEFTSIINKGKNFMAGRELTEFAKQPLYAGKNLSAEQIHAGVVKGVGSTAINPGYGLPGTKMNCRRATFAYELRRRGYDVQATKTVKGSGQTAFGLLEATTARDMDYPQSLPGIAKGSIKEQMDKASGMHGPWRISDPLQTAGFGLNKVDMGKTTKGSSRSAILTALRSQPDGSRGEVGVKWLMGGGHSISYEIIKGKPVIFDNQTGKMYKTAADFAKLEELVEEAGFTRLDNLELDMDFLTKWVK